MKPLRLLTPKHLPLLGLMIVTVFLAAAPRIGPRAEPPGPTGTWLTTLEFAGERPLEMAITFSRAGADPVLRHGEGRWNRVSARKYSIAFTMPAEIDGAPTRRIGGTLLLDERGRLRGPVIAQRMDAKGEVVDSVPGVAKAQRIAIKEQR